MTTDSEPNKSIEIERKFEAPPYVDLPINFDELGLHLVSDDFFKMHNMYFDTEDEFLASKKIAVRLRIGSHDEGWHIKIKDGERSTEYTWSVENPKYDEIMPAEVIDRIIELAGTSDIEYGLAQIAYLQTDRRELLIADEDNKELFLLVDDVVASQDEASNQFRCWREWEVELRPGVPESMLSLLEPKLFEAGATRSLTHSKIARAKGKTLQYALANGYSADQIAALAVTEFADRVSTLANDDAEKIKGLRDIAASLSPEMKAGSPRL